MDLLTVLVDQLACLFDLIVSLLLHVFCLGAETFPFDLAKVVPLGLNQDIEFLLA